MENAGCPTEKKTINETVNIELENTYKIMEGKPTKLTNTQTEKLTEDM